jgi:hypothetical protein
MSLLEKLKGFLGTKLELDISPEAYESYVNNFRQNNCPGVMLDDISWRVIKESEYNLRLQK